MSVGTTQAYKHARVVTHGPAEGRRLHCRFTSEPTGISPVLRLQGEHAEAETEAEFPGWA